MPRYKCLFSFYGSKSKVAHYYPEPEHELVIEPFADGATYSLNRALDHRVWLNDLNEDVYRLWNHLLNTPLKEILAEIPDEVEKGQRFEGDTPCDLLLQANCNMGTFGTSSDCRQVTSFAATNWHQVSSRLEAFLPEIDDWQVTNMDYRELPNREATWFIDPPYSGDAGDRYEHSEIDFNHLAEWCRARNGQVIVCEHEGADWLPFKPLGIHSMTRGNVRKNDEVVWTKD